MSYGRELLNRLLVCRDTGVAFELHTTLRIQTQDFSVRNGSQCPYKCR